MVDERAGVGGQNFQVDVALDDQKLCSELSIALARAGYSVRVVRNGDGGELFSSDSALFLGDEAHLRGLRDERGGSLRSLGAQQCILLASTATALELHQLMDDGVFWYLRPPYKIEDILVLIAKAIVLHELSNRNDELAAAVGDSVTGERVVAHSNAMRECLSQVKRIASLREAVLLTGESGTGKTLLARQIHAMSPQRGGPFVSVSCASIPRDLLESELFGYERGAFTGATRSRPGCFELADGGTIFLDEIGDLPLDMQPKILTVLQDHRARRLGSTQSRELDFRVIAATNRPLQGMIRDGSFREDLYYRLNVFQVALPPLRERGEDIVPLAQQVLRSIAEKRGESPPTLTEDSLRYLSSYQWPGNIRELENLLERASAFCNSDRISPSDLGGLGGIGSLGEAETPQHKEERS
jgi:DNA-binding NtrC family response regulator